MNTYSYDHLIKNVELEILYSKEELLLVENEDEIKFLTNYLVELHIILKKLVKKVYGESNSELELNPEEVETIKSILERNNETEQLLKRNEIENEYVQSLIKLNNYIIKNLK